MVRKIFILLLVLLIVSVCSGRILSSNVEKFTSEGYPVVAVESDPSFQAWLVVPPNISIFTNDAGYLTSYSETDPCAMQYLNQAVLTTSLPSFSGLTINTGIARFLGTVSQEATYTNRLDVGVEAGSPRIVFEEAYFTIWQMLNYQGAFTWGIPNYEMMILEGPNPDDPEAVLTLLGSNRIKLSTMSSAGNNWSYIKGPLMVGDFTQPTGALGVTGNALISGTLGAGEITGTSLRILESGSTPVKYSIFQGGDQEIDLTYTLPTAYPVSVSQVLQSTTAGILSWVTPAASVSFGTTTQIPYMNVAGTDFLYDPDLVFDGTTLTAGGFTSAGKILLTAAGNTATKLAIGTDTSLAENYKSLLELSSTATYPVADTLSSMITATMYGNINSITSGTFNFAGAFFNNSAGTRTGTTLNTWIGLYGGVGVDIDAVGSGTGTGIAMILEGVFFTVANAGDISNSSGSVTRVVDTRGLYVTSNLGGGTLAGSKLRADNYGARFLGNMVGLYNCSVAGNNYGAYIVTMDSLAAASTGNITSYAVYIAPCATSTKSGGGIVTSYGIYQPNPASGTAPTNIIQSYTRIGGIAAPTVPLDITGAISSSTTIQTASADTWDLNDYTAGTVTDTGYITVTINGTSYKLLARLEP